MSSESHPGWRGRRSQRPLLASRPRPSPPDPHQLGIWPLAFPGILMSSVSTPPTRASPGRYHPLPVSGAEREAEESERTVRGLGGRAVLRSFRMRKFIPPASTLSPLEEEDQLMRRLYLLYYFALAARSLNMQERAFK